MKCTNCNLCSESVHPCLLGVGNPEAKVMFIQDCPSELDDKKGKPFSGKANRQLIKAIVNRDIDVDDIYFTSLVKCVAPNEEPKPQNIEACSKILLSEIKVVNPDIIVPVGKSSLKFLVGKNTLLKMRGNAKEVEILGRNRIILPMMHPRSAEVKPIYKDYILKDLDTLKELCDNGMTDVHNVNYKYLDNLKDCIEEIVRLKNEATVLSFDLETTGKSPYMDWSKIVCISLSDKINTGCVIPLYKKDSPLQSHEVGLIVKLLRWLLEDIRIPKVAHNGKFDIEWLHSWLDIDVKNFSFDTMLAHYLCISEEQGTQGLKGQAWEFTDMGGYDNDLDDYKSTLPDTDGPNGRNNYDNIPWDILKKYAAADADCCLRLKEIYQPKIESNLQWKTLMEDIMMPASYTFRDIEENGMKFDSELSEKYDKTYTDEVNRITERLESYPEVLEIEREKRDLYVEYEKIKLIPKKDRTKEEQYKFEKYRAYKDFKFNWNSTNNLRELLFDRLGLVTSIQTDKGLPSTNEEAMNEMREQHEIPDLLLELRKVTTLSNMFIHKLPTMKDCNDIVHPSFNLTGTVTGRTSSENPNAQQLPRKSENPLSFQYHNEPKSLFISRYGSNGCIMNADYSALEMRIAGIISNDEALSKALLSGADLHKSTASLVWGVPIDEVPKDMRTNAKAVNFGIIYGKSGVTFARDLYYDKSGKNPKKTDDWDKAKAEGMKLVDDYLNTFSGLKSWLEKTKKFARKHGYVETMFGRKRRLPDLNSKVYTLQSNAERQSINAPIQGTGSDFTLLSLIQINNWLKKNNKKSMIIATVHDSIVFDVYIPELSEVAQKVKDIMEHVHDPYIDTIIPIISDLELGENYGSSFDAPIEEVKAIKSSKDFKEWVHDKKLKKYQKEIATLHDKGWDYKQVLEFLQEHDRPIEELTSFIVETYSED